MVYWDLWRILYGTELYGISADPANLVQTALNSSFLEDNFLDLIAINGGIFDLRRAGGCLNQSPPAKFK